jgi:putative nucleotidyltransferase with HDIG domain
MKNSSGIVAIFGEFLTRYPRQFGLLFLLLVVEGAVAVMSLLAIVPMADFLLDPSLGKPSRITQIVLGLFTGFSLSPSFWLFGSFLVGLNLLKGMMEVAIREAGEQATFDVGVHGVHAEIIKLIGRLKYRTSFGQDVYQHSIEVAFLCGIMASELGLNVKQAKRAGLLHDIGKAVDHEVEGSHGKIGAELARKYGESPMIVHAIASHHEEEKPESMLDVLVEAADAFRGEARSQARDVGDLCEAAGGFGKDRSVLSRGREILCHPGRQGDSYYGPTRSYFG